MTRSLRPQTFLTSLLPLLIAAIILLPICQFTASAQGRLRTVPARDLERPYAVPNNTRTLQPGTVLIFEMESELRSDRSKPGDRFRAQVIEPVETVGGKILIPAGTPVEGFVSGVSKAKWGRRSGVISITFSSLENARRRKVPVRARLTSANADERKLLNEDGDFRGGNPTTRDIVFIGGGAGLGAGIGAITGGILTGTAIGAAAGLTIALLSKGKDAQVKSGQRFGMELLEPLSINDFTIGSPTNGGGGGGIVGGIGDGRIPPGPLDPADATVERMRDGSVRLRINAQTPTPGWRVYTNHDIVGNVARVRLRGTPQSQSTYDNYSQQFYVSPAQEICFNDSFGSLRRVEVLGKGGAVRVALEIPSQPGTNFARAGTNTTQPRPRPVTQTPYPAGTSAGTSGGYYPGTYPPNYNPETGQTVPPPRPVGQSPSSSTNVSTLAQDVVRQVETIRIQYAIAVGYILDTNGAYRVGGARQPTQDQQQLMDSLGSLLNDLRELRANASNPYTRRNGAVKVQESLRTTQQLWNRVRLDANLNNRWNTASRDINTLLNQTLR
jgi:hypothetical protein